MLPKDVSLTATSVHAVSRDSGLAWGTVRDVLGGSGTLTSLDRIRTALKLRWSWTKQTASAAVAAQLARRRKTKALSQREMARRLGISPQTVVTLETRFRGRVETLRRYLRVLGVTEALTRTSGKRLVPQGNDAAADLVFTPATLAERIIAAFEDEIDGRVLDPCRGGGAFYNAIPPDLSRDWCKISEGRDFFDWTAPVD